MALIIMAGDSFVLKNKGPCDDIQKVLFMLCDNLLNCYTKQKKEKEKRFKLVLISNT